MKIIVFGAGALGSLFAAHLAGKNDVTLIGRDEHVDAIRRDGLRVEGVRQFHVQLDARTDLESGARADLVLLTVKAYQTPAAVEALSPLGGSGTTFLTVQNGLGNYEALKKAFPLDTVLAASCTYAAMMSGPGRVAYTGRGEILLGGTPKELSIVGTLARTLRQAGFQALGLPDIRGAIWQKAIVNAAINPLTALTGKPNGAIVEDPALLERAKKVVAEAAEVTRALKIPLPEKDVFAVVRRIAEATAKNRSSMLEDLSKGRRTEIDAINGVFVAKGKELGIATPENEALWRAIHEREKSH